MPAAYLKNLSKSSGKSITDLETLWSNAKTIADKAGHKDEFDYITGIFKKSAGIKESVELNEGIIKTLVDYGIAFRIIRMLVLPWSKQKVYKLGLVDINGNKLRKAETDEEKEELTPLVNLVLKLKRLFDKIPGGSQIAALGSAYSMIKEQCVADGISVDSLDELFTAYAADKGIVLLEDAPVNVSGGITTPGEVVVPKERNKWKDLDKVAGAHVFDVTPEHFDKIKQPKVKGASWDSHLGDDETSDRIRQFAKTYPSKPIIARRQDSQLHQWIKK